jgi:hypothetical protein
MGVTNYDEAFIEELTRDFEESGYDCGHIPFSSKSGSSSIPGSLTASPSCWASGCLWPSSWERLPR